jgi:hypothetical protein
VEILAIAVVNTVAHEIAIAHTLGSEWMIYATAGSLVT